MYQTLSWDVSQAYFSYLLWPCTWERKILTVWWKLHSFQLTSHVFYKRQSVLVGNGQIFTSPTMLFIKKNPKPTKLIPILDCSNLNFNLWYLSTTEIKQFYTKFFLLSLPTSFNFLNIKHCHSGKNLNYTTLKGICRPEERILRWYSKLK